MNGIKLAAAGLMLLAAAGAARAQESGSLAAALETYAKAEAEYDLFSGAVLVARDGDIVYQGAFGYADKDRKLPNTLATRFSVGSVGKTFTGVLVLQLVQEGRLRLTDTLDQYLPDFPYPQKSRIQIRHLLNHTSGLGNYFTHDDYEAMIPELREIDQALQLVYDQEPLFEPGTAYRYSNSGMLVLGAIIEKVTGTRYRDCLKERILDPLGMTDSGIFYPEQDVPNRAVGYSKVAEGSYEVETANEFPAFSDGGLYSTVGDMLKYERALRGDRLLSAQGKQLLFTVDPPATKYGLGWEVGEFRGSRTLGHVGGCPGFAADFLMFDEGRSLVIVLSNYTRGAGTMAAKLRFLLFGGADIPLATAYDYNFERGRHLGEVVKDYRASAEFFDRNISGPAPHLPSLFGAARSRIFGGFEVAEAIALLERYLELRPDASVGTLAAIRWLTGWGHEQLGDPDRAADFYRQSLQVDPGFKRAQDSLRQLEEKGGGTEG